MNKYSLRSLFFGTEYLNYHQVPQYKYTCTLINAYLIRTGVVAILLLLLLLQVLDVGTVLLDRHVPRLRLLLVAAVPGNKHSNRELKGR